MDAKQRIENLLVKKDKEILERIRAFLKRNYSKEITAEEILGEAVIYVMERSESWHYRSEDHLYHSLLWKCRRLVIDKRRRSASVSRTIENQEKIVEDKARDGKNMAPSPTLLLHRNNKKAAVENYINMLPTEEMKKAVTLIRIEERSFKEAAEVMGQSPQEFRATLRRGLKEMFHIAERFGARKYMTTGETS